MSDEPADIRAITWLLSISVLSTAVLSLTAALDIYHWKFAVMAATVMFASGAWFFGRIAVQNFLYWRREGSDKAQMKAVHHSAKAVTMVVAVGFGLWATELVA